jgi:hypothetical protein
MMMPFAVMKFQVMQRLIDITISLVRKIIAHLVSYLQLIDQAESLVDSNASSLSVLCCATHKQPSAPLR